MRERDPRIDERESPVMANAPEALILDLVEWVARRARPYDEVMEAWRPRLPVWEDAVSRGLVARRREGFEVAHVVVTPRGEEFLALNGRCVRVA